MLKPEEAIPLPMIPDTFAELYTNMSIGKCAKKYCIRAVCDCGEKDCELDNCPHLQDKNFLEYYKALPYHVAHLNKLTIENIASVKRAMLSNIMQVVEKDHCGHKTDAGAGDDAALLLPRCHIYRDLEDMFPEQIKEVATPLQKQRKRRCTPASAIIQTSFFSNILLLCLKIVALVISRSISILASVMDSAMDILSGLVLFVANRLAKRGIERGKYQKTIHHHQEKIKTMYAERYESLGVLSFATIMGTLAMVLIGESIESIISIATTGSAGEVIFDALPMAIIGFTIALKLSLCIGCYIVSKRNEHDQYDTVIAYRDDHRNDTLSNTVGFIGAALTYYLAGNWTYADPIAGILLSVYITVTWTLNGRDQLMNLAGQRLAEGQLDYYMVILLHEFVEIVFVHEIDQLIAYEEGAGAVIEIRLTVRQGTTVNEMHGVVQAIQSEFERLDAVERCYVHAESADSINDL